MDEHACTSLLSHQLEVVIPENQKERPPTQDEDIITFPQDKPQTGSRRKQGQSAESRTAESQKEQKEKVSQNN